MYVLLSCDEGSLFVVQVGLGFASFAFDSLDGNFTLNVYFLGNTVDGYAGTLVVTTFSSFSMIFCVFSSE